MVFKEWWIKRCLLSILKSRNRKNDVALYFDEDSLIFVRSGKYLNDCFAVRLPEHDIEMIPRYISDGSFLIYAGEIQNGIYEYLLKTRYKWQDIISWKE